MQAGMAFNSGVRELSQLRGHRQQIAKSAAPTGCSRVSLSLPIPARAEPTQRARSAERPAPAAWAALRLLADVAIPFSQNSF
jgi:hypothetical protein